ncbi:hypothetical protein [Clostridium sp. 19966]|uniref:hypothetical protein n=1 Tax=Clostridium sp. 19966 TaxID=2768166 RepID=UPI0028EC645E|nr:hypothetical protein [Clostridium sp. 19966]
MITGQSQQFFFDKGAAVIKRISDIIIEYLSDKEDNTDLLHKLFAEVLESMIDGYHALDF